jgi:hypothetical protein
LFLEKHEAFLWSSNARQERVWLRPKGVQDLIHIICFHNLVASGLANLKPKADVEKSEFKP